MRRTRVLVLAVIALVGIAGAGAALAAKGTFSSEDASQTVIEDAAAELGIEPDELSDALRNALRKQIDEAEDEGLLSEEHADALRERLESANAPLLFPGFGFRDLGALPFHGFGQLPVGVVNLDTAASFLGLTDDELRSLLADGKSLADVAEAEGKSVNGLVDALVDDARDRVDEAVDEGRLSDDEAAELKEDLRDRITELVNREPRSVPFFDRDFEKGLGPRLDPGDEPFGRVPPPFFSGPQA